jgi:hypothetical protein
MYTDNIVTNTTVARQRFGKHITEVTQSTVGPPLLGSRSLGIFRSNRQNTNNSRVIHELLDMVICNLFAWKLVQSRRVQSQGILRSSFVTVENTRSLVRNGASLRQPLTVSCYIIDCNCKGSVNKSNHPIQNPLLLVTQTPHTWHLCGLGFIPLQSSHNNSPYIMNEKYILCSNTSNFGSKFAFSDISHLLLYPASA